MIKTKFILIILLFLAHRNIFAQGFSVDFVPFCSPVIDEFSPVYFKNGLVFCSNLKDNSLITYNKKERRLFNIYYVGKKDSIKWEKIKLLAGELTTNFNEGPVTFSKDENIIYYSRNNVIRDQLGNISDSLNKIGIYSAEYSNGSWTNIKPFSPNNPQYSFLTPALSPDDLRIYFASDMPGGYGGTDLFYCEWSDNTWAEPVNLGNTINTDKNESFPFVSESGKLFFASEGHQGFGGKDIFYSQEIEGQWIKPVHLESEINSPYDDFGLVTDASFENGYFSSNRRESDDILSFTANPLQFPTCDSMLRNTHCYLFYDEYTTVYDSVPVKYEWDFGNGIKKQSLKVKHCFTEPGVYNVMLNIYDSIADTLITQISHEFEIEEIEQVYIQSVDAAIIEKALLFDGQKSNLPEFNVSEYFWDFGEGFKTRGPVSRMKFGKTGEYTVSLGVLGEKDSIGNFSKKCIYKKLKIFEDYQQLATHTAKKTETANAFEINRVAEKENILFLINYMVDGLSEFQKSKISKEFSQSKPSTETVEAGIEPLSLNFLMQYVHFLAENPDIKIEVAVHTNEKGSSRTNMELTEKLAAEILSFFVENMNSQNVSCKAYGELRPLIEKNGDQKLNKRLEFIFMSSLN